MAVSIDLSFFLPSYAQACQLLDLAEWSAAPYFVVEILGPPLGDEFMVEFSALVVSVHPASNGLYTDFANFMAGHVSTLSAAMAWDELIGQAASLEDHGCFTRRDAILTRGRV